MMLNIFWFRRDLRFEDNAGLWNALTSGPPVLPVFIFDEAIIGKLDDRDDRRITFIYEEVSRLKTRLEKSGSSLLVLHGKPEAVFTRLVNEYKVQAVYANHDYEPYARERDERIRKLLRGAGIDFNTFKDQVIFEKDEIIKDSGAPYTVFTPYSRKWTDSFRQTELPQYPSEELYRNYLKTAPFQMPDIRSLGFVRCQGTFPPRLTDREILAEYGRKRDYPALNGTSRLGVHLRFGTISIRQLARQSSETSPVFLNELIWREFYMMILWHFPHVAGKAFKARYDRIDWRNDENDFKAWCEGLTGYPIVDAGMRELNSTGYMHNRLRMITASFLTKHLLIDWRWGEAYFARKLLDFELSSNNGGWQWAAGTGCDAAPYFRVFNPALQAQKFDPQSDYTRKFVPEYSTGNYPPPLVGHAFARQRAIHAYKRALD